jgi:endonuclease YncB( thermonuclease family)
MPVHGVFKKWKPKGQTLGLADAFKLVDIHDGDTPSIRMPIRMLSVDTPEVTARSATGAKNWDGRLSQLAVWIEAGRAPIDPELAAVLLPKIAHGRAGSLQFKQGSQASDFAKENVVRRLAKPGGKVRNLFVRTADQPFDDNGRLLAYLAPDYTEQERAAMSLQERATFNLDLLAAGWAAPFMIFPSLPKREDLELFVENTRDAVTAQRGAWAEPNYLPGYEYRMLEKVFHVTRRMVEGEKLTPKERKSWRSRWCIDMKRRRLFGPESYSGIPHEYRLWVWPQGVERAREDFGLVDG